MSKRDDHLEQLALAERKARSRLAPRPSRVKASQPNPPATPDLAHRSRTVDEVCERLERRDAATRREAEAVRPLLRAVRKAERHSGDGQSAGGTGQSILKLRQPPVAQLIDAKRIGPDERLAADEIEEAFVAITLRQRIKSQGMQKLDGSRPTLDLEKLVRDGAPLKCLLPWPARSAMAIARYQAWAGHWSKRALAGDPTLAIVVAAVIDQRPIRTIAADEGIGPKRAIRAIVGGLRDYAARSGLVTGGLAARWRREASEVFQALHPELSLAMARARSEMVPSN